MQAEEIIEKYISFFEKREHKRIANAPLIPENDPTTLFTSSGMQPLVPYLMGELHPLGKRLVNVQNCFRAADIEEVGDNRHTTFFRMLGNWSLGGYFKKEQLPWIFEFFTKELKIPAERLYVTAFDGYEEITKDEESGKIWKDLIPKERIFYYPASKNWWSRSGEPKDMPEGEIGGSASEIFYEFADVLHDEKFGEKCHPNCQCGRFLEIGNSVFITYKKAGNAFSELPQKNVDFGGGLERILSVMEQKSDVFKNSLFYPIVQTIENTTSRAYQNNPKEMRIIADHLIASVFISDAGINPSNKEQGYILRRLIRRGLDNFHKIDGNNIEPIIEKIAQQYSKTDKDLLDNFEKIKNTILEEKQNYKKTVETAKAFIVKKYGNELMGIKEISSEDAFLLYTTHGLSPAQIKSLGYTFDEQKFSDLIKEHQLLSRKGALKKFSGGLADKSEKTIMGHTATHLLHKALRMILGEKVHQTGSNITNERVRFDFSYDKSLTAGEIKDVEDLVNEKIKENLKVTFEVMDKEEALKKGALGFFVEKYEEKVKVYKIGPWTSSGRPFSVEICGGPHVDFTGRLKSFKIIKQENIGGGNRRIYAKIG